MTICLIDVSRFITIDLAWNRDLAPAFLDSAPLTNLKTEPAARIPIVLKFASHLLRQLLLNSMKQVLQNLRDGTTIVENIPIPTVRSGQILVRTLTTLISAGTEKMLVEFGNASYLNKAKQQPEKVREVLDKIRTDGLVETVQAVRSKLDQPLTNTRSLFSTLKREGSRTLGRIALPGPFSIGSPTQPSSPTSKTASPSTSGAWHP